MQRRILLLLILASGALGSAFACAADPHSPLPPPQMPGFAPLERRPQAPQKLTPPAGPIDAARVPIAADAAAWALQDIKLRTTLPSHPGYDPHCAPFIRYLWVPPWGDISWHQTNSFIVNSTASRSPVMVLPESAANGWLIVWDLRRLATKEHELANLLVVWDSFAVNDPYFHCLLPHGKVLPTREHTWIDGKTYKHRRFVPAPHVTPAYQLLEAATHSFAPLLRADDFLRRAISTQENGRYYELMGFVVGGKRLNRAEILEQVGLSIILSRKVEGDRRAAMFHSALSGKPRTAEQVQGAIGRASIVYDIFKEDISPERHPLYELLNFVDRSRGQEMIYELPNGLMGFVLFDGAGKLAIVAPPNLVADFTSPVPGTMELFPMISCLRCHAPEGGVKPCRNDVPALLADGDRGDIDYLDEIFGKADRRAQVERATGLYAAGDKFKNTADLRRIDYADAVWKATNGMGVTGDENVTTKCFNAISAQYADYWYPRGLFEPNVTSDRAAMELGWKVPPGTGTAFLRQMMKPGRADVVIDGIPVEFADPSLGALKRGIGVRRQDWERIFFYAATISSEHYQKLQGKVSK